MAAAAIGRKGRSFIRLHTKSTSCGLLFGGDYSLLLGSNATLSCRHMSQLVNKESGTRPQPHIVDTMALVKSLEAHAIQSKQAEAITSAITKVLNDRFADVAQSFVSLDEMQKNDSQKLKNDIEKMHAKLRFEIDKLTSGQRLDLNREKGHTRDMLAKQNAKTTELTAKLDREIHALRVHLEASKYDVIKACVGTLVSIAAVSLATIRLL